jgi:uncharacterized LabA/DUF88 family protein
MVWHQSQVKVGVYVDAANIYRNGGSRMQYDVLREFACRDMGEPVRLNAYVTHDTERAQWDFDYRVGAFRFHSALRDLGYKVIIKQVRWYDDEAGNRYAKANSDLDLAVDALLQSENLDRVLIATGDGDFVQVVRALQNKGCRVEVVAFDNVSGNLRQEVDLFMSGYLIPNLLPVPNGSAEWGHPDSTVRGWCYYYNEDKGFGYMRFLTKVSPHLWLVDKRKSPDSPYESAFFHFSMMQDDSVKDYLPSREHIFEFRLIPSERDQSELTATNIRIVCSL